MFLTTTNLDGLAVQYCFTVDTDRAVTWGRAKDQCEAATGRTLLVDHNQDIHAFLEDQLRDSGIQRLWIGGINTGTTGEWIWADGVSLGK